MESENKVLFPETLAGRPDVGFYEKIWARVVPLRRHLMGIDGKISGK